MLVAQCIASDVINPFTGGPSQKYTLASGVVLIDVLIVISFLIFIQFMEASQKAYVKKFKD